MAEYSWEENIYHYITVGGQKKLVPVAEYTQAETSKAIEKILNRNSPDVMKTDGYFIRQSEGWYNCLFGKPMLIENKYRATVITYLNMNNGHLTLAAKKAFDSGNDRTIDQFMEKMRNSQKYNNTTSSKSLPSPSWLVHMRRIGKYY